jgi:hypothetical protein
MRTDGVLLVQVFVGYWVSFIEHIEEALIELVRWAW